ncbi:hypothetical protein YC2023_120216 [Brassica napus]
MSITGKDLVQASNNQAVEKTFDESAVLAAKYQYHQRSSGVMNQHIQLMNRVDNDNVEDPLKTKYLTNTVTMKPPINCHIFDIDQDQYGKTYERRRCTPQTQILELVVLVLEGATPIFLGSQLEFHVHHAKEVATVVKLVAMLDPQNRGANKNSLLVVSLQHPVCVETFSESRALGRVFLRSSGRTVAMGRVTRIIQNS